MRFPFVLLLAVAAWSTPLSLVRAQQTPSPIDPKAVLTAIKDLRTKQAGIITKEKSGVLAAINAAMADPGKAYEQAVAAVEQQGQGVNDTAKAPEPPPRPGGRPSAAREADHAAEARKRLNDQLRDHDFVNGLRLQLAYLSLTWQHGMGVKTRALLPGLLDYTTQVNTNYETLAPLDMFRRSLGEDVFVAYFQIGPYINGLPDWSDHPFDVDSIFQKTILPEMRRDKDPRLLGYWDGHLQTEGPARSPPTNGLTSPSSTTSAARACSGVGRRTNCCSGQATRPWRTCSRSSRPTPTTRISTNGRRELEGIVSAEEPSRPLAT